MAPAYPPIGPNGPRRARLQAIRVRALEQIGVDGPGRLPAGLNGRWTRRHWAHASLFATLGMLAAALVPGFSVAMQTPAATPRTTLAIALPTLPAARLEGVPGDSWQVMHVRRGQTLGAMFKELGLPAGRLQAILDQPGARAALTRLQPGTEVAFDMPVAASGQLVVLRGFRYDSDASHRVELTFDDGQVRERVIERPTETRTVVVSGRINGGSLYAAARKAGLQARDIDVLTDEIFKYDVDFDKDLKRGDRFSVVREELWREGQRVSAGPILAATFTTGDTIHSGFRYLRNGKPEYFTGDGRPLKKTFIRMPIPYARLTSSFGARRHPVLGRMRMHKGVDYGAGSGTPIMAAGDARVEYVGWKGGYGRVVILDHGRGYSTLYGHMSRFGKIRPGQRIDQGTLIGYVGSTGLATGPHLHYEFRVGGVHRNPLSITMPPPEPLTGRELAAFRAQTGPALARIRTVENVIYADVTTPAPQSKTTVKKA